MRPTNPDSPIAASDHGDPDDCVDRVDSTWPLVPIGGPLAAHPPLTGAHEMAERMPAGRQMTKSISLDGGLSMNDLDVTRSGDDQEPFVARVIDLDDGADPWSAWDDIGGNG